MNYKKIGKKIADRRILLGITQEELAEKVDSSANYISNIETGIKSGSLIFYIKVANELKLSLDFLFSDELPNLDTSEAKYYNSEQAKEYLKNIKENQCLKK